MFIKFYMFWRTFAQNIFPQTRLKSVLRFKSDSIYYLVCQLEVYLLPVCTGGPRVDNALSTDGVECVYEYLRPQVSAHVLNQ